MITGQRNSNLTEGMIWKTLVVFTLPILAGNFFQHLYTTADAVIVGRFTGKEGLAAIDSVFSLLKLPVNLFSGLSAGSSILISQLYGAKKYTELSKTMHTALMLTFIIGMVLSAVGVFLSPALLVMMGVPADIFDATLIYVRIYFSGMLISLFYNIAAGILRAIGNSTILYFGSVPLGKLFISSDDYGILTITERLMHLLAPFYTVFVFTEIFSAAMYGIGETVKPTIITLLGICVFRMLWIWCVVPHYPSYKSASFDRAIVVCI